MVQHLIILDQFGQAVAIHQRHLNIRDHHMYHIVKGAFLAVLAELIPGFLPIAVHIQLHIPCFPQAVGNQLGKQRGILCN